MEGFLSAYMGNIGTPNSLQTLSTCVPKFGFFIHIKYSSMSRYLMESWICTLFNRLGNIYIEKLNTSILIIALKLLKNKFIYNYINTAKGNITSERYS